MTLRGSQAENAGERADFSPGDDYFHGLKRPFGDRALDLAIGSQRMRLEGLDQDQAGELRERFRAFVEDVPGRPDVTIGLRHAGVEGFLRMPRPGEHEVYRLESRVAGTRRAIWAYEFAGWIEGTDGRGTLALVEREGPQYLRGLENFLRVVTASWILRRGGFLLHASGIVRDGKAYVFFGPSGAGKTTVTDLSPDDTILSDDLTLVVAEAGGYRAAGIPFGLAHHKVPDTRRSFPIGSLNRLVQSRSVRREPMRGARAVAAVAASLPFVMQETGQAVLAIETVWRALLTIPVYRLEFRKDDAFWGVVAPREN